MPSTETSHIYHKDACGKYDIYYILHMLNMIFSSIEAYHIHHSKCVIYHGYQLVNMIDMIYQALRHIIFII